MTYSYNKLRGRIVEHFGGTTAFAKALGLSNTSLSLKLNNRVPFTQPEIDKALDLLKIPENDIANYFFTHVVQSA